jgi:predicted transcriptional regulator
MSKYESQLVLAVTRDNADAILSGKRAVEVRRFPPRRLPARAYLAITGTAAVHGECVLGEPVGSSADGTLLPIAEPKAYRRPKPIDSFGLEKIPRSFRYVR